MAVWPAVTVERTGKCVFDDVVNELAPKFEEADGLVASKPGHIMPRPMQRLIAVLDRLFYSTHFDKTMKVGASVVMRTEEAAARLPLMS